MRLIINNYKCSTKIYEYALPISTHHRRAIVSIQTLNLIPLRGTASVLVVSGADVELHCRLHAALQDDARSPAGKSLVASLNDTVSLIDRNLARG